MGRDTRIFKEHLSLVVLSVLRSRAMYGYELVQTVKQRSGEMLNLREGVLYPLLHRLVEEGLLTSQWGDSEKGPRRRYYRLTAKGQRTRDEQTNQWRSFVGVIDHVIGVEACLA